MNEAGTSISQEELVALQRKFSEIKHSINNALAVMMALSEMLGVTSVHEMLPWYFKWWWICALAGGNLVIHLLMLKKTREIPS